MSFIEVKSNDELLNYLEKYYDVVVYFTGKSCSACKTLNPNLHKILNRYDGLTFLKADMDICNDVAEICNINAVPTFIMFRNGKSHGHVIGADLHLIINSIDKVYL